MPASNGRIWRCTFSMACLTSKAICPADEAHDLIKLKRYIFIGSCPFLFQIVADSIKTPFLARGRLNSTAPIPSCPLRPAPGHRLWCRHGVLRSRGSQSLLKGAPSDSAIGSRHEMACMELLGGWIMAIPSTVTIQLWLMLKMAVMSDDSIRLYPEEAALLPQKLCRSAHCVTSQKVANA